MISDLVEDGLVPASLCLESVHNLVQHQQGSFCGADVE